jgi:hypothetical protein
VSRNIWWYLGHGIMGCFHSSHTGRALISLRSPPVTIPCESQLYPIECHAMLGDFVIALIIITSCPFLAHSFDCRLFCLTGLEKVWPVDRGVPGQHETLPSLTDLSIPKGLSRLFILYMNHEVDHCYLILFHLRRCVIVKAKWAYAMKLSMLIDFTFRYIPFSMRQTKDLFTWIWDKDGRRWWKNLWKFRKALAGSGGNTLNKNVARLII